MRGGVGRGDKESQILLVGRKINTILNNIHRALSTETLSVHSYFRHVSFRHIHKRVQIEACKNVYHSSVCNGEKNEDVFNVLRRKLSIV